MRALPLIPLLLGGWLTLPALAANSSAQAGDWLKRLAQAEQQQSYQGTFVYERNGSFSTHDIWHRVQSGKVSERLLQLDGSAQEVVRVDGQTQCVSGALVPGVANTPESAARVLDPLKLMSWYDLGSPANPGWPTVKRSSSPLPRVINTAMPSSCTWIKTPGCRSSR